MTQAERLKQLGQNIEQRLAQQEASAVRVVLPDMPAPLGHFADDEPTIHREFSRGGPAAAAGSVYQRTPRQWFRVRLHEWIVGASAECREVHAVPDVRRRRVRVAGQTGK